VFSIPPRNKHLADDRWAASTDTVLVWLATQGRDPNESREI